MGKFGMNPGFGMGNSAPAAPAPVTKQPWTTMQPPGGGYLDHLNGINFGSVTNPPAGGIGKGTIEPKGPFDQAWSQTPVPLGPDGRPLAPEFNTVGDDKTGLLKSPYNLTNNLDPRAMDAARSEAFRPAGEMSKWGQMALSQAQNQNAAAGAGQMAQARSGLAMQGGLRSGARERIAMQGMKNNLTGNQTALSGVKMADEENRQKWLQMMPGLEQQNAQYGQGIQDKNISRALQELNIGRGMQQGQFTEAMRAWGADKTAQASRPQESGGLLSNIFGGLF